MDECFGWFDDFDGYCCFDCPYGYKCFYYTYGYYWDDDYSWY